MLKEGNPIYCPFCGAELVDGVCPNKEQHLKQMCINCAFNEAGCCINEANMELAKAKIMQSVPNGYEIEELKLKPLPLRDPRKRCNNWGLNGVLVSQAVKMFEN
jgi:hypothetical protein